MPGNTMNEKYKNTNKHDLQHKYSSKYLRTLPSYSQGKLFRLYNKSSSQLVNDYSYELYN